MSSPIAHWDEGGRRRVEQGSFRAVWTDLGRAAGSVALGARRAEIDPGARSTPVHMHTAEEEIFFVLAGSGLSWQDGRAFEVNAGDCLVHLPRKEAHTLVAGPEGLDVLVFGTRLSLEVGHLPRADVAWLGPTWTNAGDGPHPWAREMAAGELDLPAPSERPSTIVSLKEAKGTSMSRGDFVWTSHDLGRAAGSVSFGLRHVTLEPGRRSFPLPLPHGGGGAVRRSGGDGGLHPGRGGASGAAGLGRGAAGRHWGGPRLRAGDVTMVYLACGLRDPQDVAWYPDVGQGDVPVVSISSEALRSPDYWDGDRVGSPDQGGRGRARMVEHSSGKDRKWRHDRGHDATQNGATSARRQQVSDRPSAACTGDPSGRDARRPSPPAGRPDTRAEGALAALAFVNFSGPIAYFAVGGSRRASSPTAQSADLAPRSFERVAIDVEWLGLTFPLERNDT